MPTIALRLKPLDVLLFRDARPFSAGDTASTRLPLPQTLAGLVKTHIHHRHGWKNSSEWHRHHDKPIEERPWHARLVFRGPWLFVDEPQRSSDSAIQKCPWGPLFPAPADLVRLGKSRKDPISRSRPLSAEMTALLGDSQSHPGLRPLWHVGDKAPKLVTGFLDANGVKQYLNDESIEKIQFHAEDCFFTQEHRTGIGIHPDRLVADQDQGLIYSASFLRLQPGVCFYGEVDLPDAPDMPSAETLFPSGLTLPWGGEGRRVLVERTDPYPWTALQPSPAPEDGERFLSLLISPGIFSNGQHRWMPKPYGTLVAAAVPKPLPVSGWDLAGDADNGHQPRPRPTQFAVPAGAVYFWERGNRAIKQGKTQLPAPLESPCDRPQDRDNGWGLSLFGIWNECTFEKGPAA
jgi:CRISPR-associated protein Cmr3